MPYYLHLASVSAEALAASFAASAFPPGWADHGPDACDCETCKDRAWETYWLRPDVPWGFRPVAVDLAIASFTTPAEAHAAKKTYSADEPLAVTFIATEDERVNWRRREDRKVTAGIGCQHTPWRYEDWYSDTLHALHHAYLSVEKPGLVAYTPSEEWGVADRQLRVRPGRYLEQFAPHLTTVERDAFCAKVKAIDDTNVVQFATTAEEIVRVYRNGPNSCMSHQTSAYATDGTHPVAVYGNSDLQLAYLAGANGNNGRNIRARALVWPDKKIHSRIYGDTALRYLLEALGYKKDSLAGAKVRAIRLTHDVYVMPYVDGIATANHIGQYFVLCDSEREEGEYLTQETNGTTDGNHDSEEPQYTCRNCENDVDDEGDLCQSCEDERHTCTYCDDEFFEDSPNEIEDYGVMCRSCYRRHTRQCDECRDRFCEEAYSHADKREREDEELTDYCLSCGADVLETRNEEREAAREAERLHAEWQTLMRELQTALNMNGLNTRARSCAVVIAIGIEVA